MRKIIALLTVLCMTVTLMGGLAAAGASEEPYKFSIFANLITVVPELQPSDIAFFEELGRRTNTIIDVQIPPSSNYTEAITIMLASMEYPDVVLFPDHTMKPFVDACANGIVLPVNEYIANAPNIMAYTYDVSWKTLKILGDDNIYAIPRTSVARADGFELRQDWLDTLGISYTEGTPLTLDAFKDMLYAFTYNDPDGNGVQDTYGLAMASGDGNLIVSDPIGWAFGLIGWQEYEDEPYQFMDLKKSRDNDAFKQALAYVSDLYANKLIDPDWPTLDTNAMSMRMQQGITGMRGEFAGWMIDLETLGRSLNPAFTLTYLPGLVKNEGDKVQGGSFSTGFWGEFAIMASAKNPQKIVDVFDYMLSDNFWPEVSYGLEGIAWNYDEAGNKIAIPGANYNAGRQMFRRNNAPEFFVSLTVAVENRQRLSDLIGQCIDQAVFSKDEGFRPAVADDPAYIDANNAYNRAVSQIIAGDRPLEDYDSILDAWYKGGGETYIQQMNEGILANQ